MGLFQWVFFSGVFLFTSMSLAQPDSDSGIYGPTYIKILSKMDAWAKLDPQSIQVIQYGQSIKGKPLKLVLVSNPLISRPKTTFVMTGSTHGNEYLNIEDRLPEELINKFKSKGRIQSFIREGGAFVFIPIVNPDGYESRTRENSNGVDLNRDFDVLPANFKGFTEPETKALSRKLEQLTLPPYNLRYTVTVDYHCCIGAVLYPWSFQKQTLPPTALKDHINLAEMAKQELQIDHGTTGEILGYYPVGTSKDYYYSRYGARTFTYEGRYKEENAKLPSHIAWWEAMVGYSNKYFDSTNYFINLPTELQIFPNRYYY